MSSERRQLQWCKAASEAVANDVKDFIKHGFDAKEARITADIAMALGDRLTQLADEAVKEVGA